jgi:hypothetical protein
VSLIFLLYINIEDKPVKEKIFHSHFFVRENILKHDMIVNNESINNEKWILDTQFTNVKSITKLFTS